MKTNGVLQIVLGATLFGVIPFFVRFAPNLSVSQIALGRAIFATLFALLLIYFSKGKLKRSDLKGKNLMHLFIWSIFLTLAIVFYFLAINIGSVAIAGTLMGMHPLFVVFFSVLFFKEKIHFITYLSCFVAVLGGAFIGFSSGFLSNGAVLGGFFALGSALFLGLNFTYHLKYLNQFSSSSLVFYQNILQIPILLPFVFFLPVNINLNGMISIISLGIVCTGLAYYLVYNGSKFVKKQFIGVLQMIENVIPVFLGIFLFQEKIGSMEWIGIVLILISAVLIGFIDDCKES